MAAWKPTEKDRAQVKGMAAVATSVEDMALILGVTATDIRKHCAKEIETGAALGRYELKAALRTEAKAGKASAAAQLARAHQVGAMEGMAVTRKDLAEYFGCTLRTVETYAAEGILPKPVSKGGDYPLKESTARVMTHLRSLAAGRQGAMGAGDLDLAQERAALARAQREAKEMENEVTRGDLIERPKMEAEIGRIGTIIVRALAPLADRLERDCRLPPEAVERVEQVIRDLRSELGDAIMRGGDDD